MSLKMILAICCLVEMVFAVPVAEPPNKFERKLEEYNGKFTSPNGHVQHLLHGNCSGAKVRLVDFHHISCNKSAYEMKFCQIYSALQLVNTSMCKNLSEIYPPVFLHKNAKCNLSTDSITMKNFLPKVKHYAENLFRHCAYKKQQHLNALV